MTRIIYTFKCADCETCTVIPAGSREDAIAKIKELDTDCRSWEIVDSYIAHPSRY